MTSSPKSPAGPSAADVDDRRAAITILCALGVFGWFVGTFLYWAMGPGSFHVFDGEARLDLAICGGLGTLALIGAAAISVNGWRQDRRTARPGRSQSPGPRS